MKYVMFARQHCGVTQDIPIIFPDHLIHAHVAAVIGALPDMKDAKPVSAGTLPSFGFDGECSGKSDTLKLDARDEDSAIIKMHDYLHGM